MLNVTGTISVLPSDLADFIASMRVLAVDTRQRDGNLSYNAAVLDSGSAKTWSICDCSTTLCGTVSRNGLAR